MKPALQMQIGQQLTLTPQLQQAIRLLQLSSQELQQEIQETLNNNPLLELSDDGNSAETRENETPDPQQMSGADFTDLEPTSSPGAKDTESSDSGTDLELALTQNTLPEELPTDSAWEDVWQSGSNQTKNYDELQTQDQTRSKATSLQDHLLWQAEISRMTEDDHMIATALIDAINEHGFLGCSLNDIQEALNQQTTDPIDVEQIEAVLQQIQNFEPVGVGARDLQESLQLQIRNLSPETPYRSEAMWLLTEHFATLATRDHTLLLRKTKWSEALLQKVLALIQTLNPRPANTHTELATDYVIPDVRVVRRRDTWIVELNQDTLPKLRINQTYASLMHGQRPKGDTQYIKQHMQEARWFLKSLQSRNETLLKVANAIIEYQSDFLNYGPEHMKPLVLHDVAETIGMHESTVSRITTQKFIETPRGVFELKYFFSSHLGTQSGGECSSTAIRARIKKLISEEPTHKPLSDSKIAAILAKEGVNVARRTVAKYREALRIGSSSERKRLR